jgi:hypothetical protein
MPESHWATYEEVAQFILNEMASRFGLGRVEGKQVVPGASGTEWEIDAKGVRDGDGGFLIVECRRYMTRGVPQDQVGGLAYRIRDTGAVGGIVVSPLDLQAGAQLVAKHEGIQSVRISAESTTTAYVLRFLNDTFIKVEPAVLHLRDVIVAEMVPPNPK